MRDRGQGVGGRGQGVGGKGEGSVGREGARFLPHPPTPPTPPTPCPDEVSA
ncbi:MAG: hypothetical protein ACRAVC_07275 [Trichormus sp.]